MIPEAAVEAAAKVLYRELGGLIAPHVARAALEAAAPLMLAEAWNDGHNAGVDHADGLFGGDNPYRSQG